MQIDKIRNFNIIEAGLRKLYPQLFYTLPNSKEAIAPVKRQDLYSLLCPCNIYNPYNNDNMGILECLYNIYPIPDKNYEHYEIFQGLDIWVLCFRLYNDDVSIIGVSEAI